MINQLPPEILAHVFDFSRNHKLPSVFENTGAPDLSLVAISSVCRYWREIAVGLPNLWTNIDTAHVRNAAAFLQRSGVAPLNVSIRQPWPREDGTRLPMDNLVCQTFAAHSARLHELHIQIYPMDPDDFVPTVECFGYPAPNLRSLSLSAHWSSQARLPVIFGGHNPRLERLVLEGIRSWTGNSFRNLTHLTFSGQSLDRHLTCQLHEVLAASPRLSELFLCFKKNHLMRNYLDIDFVPIPAPTTPIILDHLRTLYIHAGYASDLVSLVSCLVIPPGVTIYVHDTIITADGHNDFEHMLSDNLGGLLNFSKLGIQLYGFSSIKLTGVSGPTVFSLHLQWKASVFLLAEFIDVIFAKARTSPIRELHLKHFDSGSWNGARWLSRFRGMASLEEVVVIGKEYMPDSILVGLLPFENQSGEVEVPCPDLLVLQILCPPMKGGAIPSLIQTIKQRRANYCSIQLLLLSQAYLGISVDDMAQIRNEIKVEFVSNPNHISETEFPEVYDLKDIWPPRW